MSCFGASVGGLWYLGKYSHDGSRFEVLALFGAGALLAGAAGVLVAQRLRRHLQAWRGSIICGALGASTLLVSFVTTQLTMGFRFFPLVWECLLIAGALLLLAVDSYLVGFLLLPVRRSGPGLLRLLWIAALYVPIPAGANSGIHPVGRIRLHAVDSEDDQRALRQGRWNRLHLAAADSPTFQMIQDSSNAIRLIVHSPFTPAESVFVDDVISATSSSIELEAGRVELVDHALLGPKVSSINWDEDFDNRWLDRLGVPVGDRADFNAMRSDFETQYALILDMDRGLRASPMRALLQSLDLGVRIDADTRVGGNGFDTEAKRRYLLLSLPRYYLPGPAELVFDLWWGESVKGPFPIEQRSMVKTTNNRIILVDLLAGAYTALSTETEEVYESYLLEASGQFGLGGVTTAVVYTSISQPKGSIRMRVLSKEGHTIGHSFSTSVAGLHCFQFKCDLKDIREYSLLISDRLTRLRIPLEIEDFPEANRECRDVLNMRVPLLEIKDPSLVEAFLERVIGWTFRNHENRAPRDMKTSLLGASIRGILDTYYPNNWYVGRDFVIIARPFQPSGILAKVAHALGYFEEGRIDPATYEALKAIGGYIR